MEIRIKIGSREFGKKMIFFDTVLLCTLSLDK